MARNLNHEVKMTNLIQYEISEDFFDKLLTLNKNAQKMLAYVIKNSRNGVLIATQAKIAEDMGTTKGTVHARIYMLRKEGFVMYQQNGTLLLNPHVICRGNENTARQQKRYFDKVEKETSFDRARRSAAHPGYKGKMFTDTEYAAGASWAESKNEEEKDIQIGDEV